MSRQPVPTHSLNHSYGRRLHWLVRVEGKHESNRSTGHTSEEARTHLHFLLGRHKVADGHKHQFDAIKASAFLENVWEYGRSEVVPYDQSKDGVGYVLKCSMGPTASEWDDQIEMSPSLRSYLIGQKIAADQALRDSIAGEMFLGLRRGGTDAIFGHEVPRGNAA